MVAPSEIPIVISYRAQDDMLILVHERADDAVEIDIPLWRLLIEAGLSRDQIRYFYTDLTNRPLPSF